MKICNNDAVKNIFIFILVGTLLSGSIIVFAQKKAPVDWLSITLKPQEKRKCGLHKLSQKEQSALNSAITKLIMLISNSHSLENSAIEYLKNDGWEEVEVRGTREIKSETYLIVEKGAFTYILEPRSYSYDLSPGKYLGKMGWTSSEIINADGDEVSFWTESTE